MRISHVLGIVAVAALGVLALQIAQAPSSKQATFHVFDSVESCARIKGEAASIVCADMEAEARSVADSLIWPFATKEDCVASHGADNCYQGNDDRWRVKMAGFTQFSRDTAFRSILPVFHSSTYPGLYLPNGYPVLNGANTILDRVLALGGYMAGKPRSLAQDLCVKESSELICRPLHTFVSRARLELPVVGALFSDRP
jgi:hypothetical protein